MKTIARYGAKSEKIRRETVGQYTYRVVILKKIEKIYGKLYENFYLRNATV